MRKHLVGWPSMGLLCAALGSAAIGQDRTTPEAAVGPTLTLDTSSSAIQNRERWKDPEQRKIWRANARQSIEREYVLLDQVLTLDANTRSKLFDLLTDLRMESADRYANEPRGMRTGPSYPSWEALQAAVERERFGANNDLQRSASQATRDRQRMRNVLGEARHQQYLDYETTAFERAQVAYFNQQLPTDNKLDPSQRERLILLLNERRQQEDEARNLAIARMNGETARRGRSLATGRAADLEGLRRFEQHLQQVEADSKQLLAQLAGVLTPPQLAVYEANETKRLAQQLQMVKRIRKRAGVDIENPPVLPPEPAAVVSPRTPLAGRVQLEVTIKVNESAIMQRSLLADNGAVMTFEVAPLTIEVLPSLFDDGWRELTLKFYEPDGKGGRRRIIPNTSGSEFMAGAEPVQKLDATMLWASRGYAIIGNFTLSAANP